MTPLYLFDTDTCIKLRRGADRGLEARFQALQPGTVAISVITFGELTRGALGTSDPARARATLDRFVALVPVLSLAPETGRLYGEIRYRLERAGQIIGGNDLWIAAHALAAGLTLVSGNIREFRRVEGLKVENWIMAR